MRNRKPRKLGCFILLLALVGLVVLAAYFLVPRATVAQWSAVEHGILVQHDITYCKGGGIELKMDLYLPPPLEERPAPALVYVHGGGWQTGDKDWVNRILLPRDLVARGYIVAAINYRLAPQYQWPAQIEDVKCAVRYLRSMAEEYHLDPDSIGAWGESAGGHLVSMLGLTGPNYGFEGYGGYFDQPSSVNAVVEMSGPTDFRSAEANPANATLEQLLLGVIPDADMLARVSPVSYATAAAPPFLIIHGDKDTTVPFEHAQKLYDGLTAVGAKAQLATVQNSEHVFTPADASLPITPTLSEIDLLAANFFDSTLQPDQSTVHTFPETGRTVRGVFLDLWNRRGGVPYPGYPLSEAIVEGDATVQYFERAVLEYRPTTATPPGLSVRRIGSTRYKELYGSNAPGQQPNNAPGSTFYAQTGKRLGGRFLEYWAMNGGLTSFGYPISDEFTEILAPNGTPILVQYFERAVFEYHPENAAPNDVVLPALGGMAYKALYPEAP